MSAVDHPAIKSDDAATFIKIILQRIVILNMPNSTDQVYNL
jgi:hypothetical protein